MRIQVDDTIALEPFSLEYAADFFALINVNRRHLRTWLPWVDKIRCEADFEKFMERSRKRQASHSEISFAILCNGVLAGRIGLYSISRQHKIAQIGYWLAKSFQGKGIITKACTSIIQYAFMKLCMNRLEIHCATGNYKSQSIPERLHFNKEGIIRQGAFLNNIFVDLYAYALLKHEWHTSQLPA